MDHRKGEKMNSANLLWPLRKAKHYTNIYSPKVSANDIIHLAIAGLVFLATLVAKKNRRPDTAEEDGFFFTTVRLRLRR